jgi:hypothetical protein
MTFAPRQNWNAYQEDRLSRWAEKIALRQKLIAIYQALDAGRDG